MALSSCPTPFPGGRTIPERGAIMQLGAVIVAAGRSSRMGDFKPMLNIGSISIAQRIIATFHQAGVSKIAMVTGYNAEVLERHLSGNGIVFLRNPDYATTQMFDSAKIGLEYLKDKCDRILFTPVDIPLFTQRTVEALIACPGALANPVCDGESGHPIIFDSALLDWILDYQGQGGLKAAIAQCGIPMTPVPVDDRGILHDADTPEDYKALLHYHNRQLIRPVVSVSLAQEQVFFDQQLSMLLTMVDETHSVRTACNRMQISYSTGWNMIRKLESQISRPLIERTQGGNGGGGSYLTADGRRFLEVYDRFVEQLREEAGRLFHSCFDEVF